MATLHKDSVLRVGLEPSKDVASQCFLLVSFVQMRDVSGFRLLCLFRE